MNKCAGTEARVCVVFQRSVWRRVVALLALLTVGAMEWAGGASVAGPGPVVGAVGGPVPASRRAPNLAIITIHDPIDAITAVSVKRRIDEAAAGGADGIVFDIDSPGGEVGAVLEISRAIKASPVTNTVGWVHSTAYSGAAVAALACRQIVLAPGATMGDIGVIGGDPIGLSFFQGLKPTERAKGLSVVLTEVVDSARSNGYDEMLVQGFVTLGVELWLIRDKRTGKEYFVSEAEYRGIFGEKPARVSPRVGSIGLGKMKKESDARGEGGTVDFTEMNRGEGGSASRPVDERMRFRPASPELAHPEMEKAFNLGISTPSPRPDFGSADVDRYELVEYATDGNTLLTLKEADLKRYGFGDSAVTIRNDQELRQYMGATNVRRLDQNWSESLVGFMTMGVSGLVIRGLLVVVFLLGLFIEMATPGVGAPGVVALLALAGLIVPPMLLGASNWWAGASVVVGLALIILEVFVLPGFGVPGVVGLMLLLAGLVGAMAGTGELFPGSNRGGGTDLAWVMAVVMLAFFVAGTGAYFFSKYTHKFPIAGRLVLADRQNAEEESDGSGSVLLAMGEGGGAISAGGVVAAGERGVTRTPLRPSGTAQFGDTLVDVVSEFGFVEAGRAVRVVSVTEYRVGVEPIREDDEGHRA